MRTIERSTQFKRDFKRESKGRHAATLDADLIPLLRALADLLPADGRWRHAHGSPGHGRSHVMPALIPPYASVPVIAGRLALGTWQSICLVDLNVDNAVRSVRLSFLPG